MTINITIERILTPEFKLSVELIKFDLFGFSFMSIYILQYFSHFLFFLTFLNDFILSSPLGLASDSRQRTLHLALLLFETTK